MVFTGSLLNTYLASSITTIEILVSILLLPELFYHAHKSCFSYFPHRFGLSGSWNVLNQDL